METEVSTILGLLDLAIAWRRLEDDAGWCAIVGGDRCELTMNDFPAEPLYTLTWRGESLDFDDAPRLWSIPFG